MMWNVMMYAYIDYTVSYVPLISDKLKKPITDLDTNIIYFSLNKYG